MPREVVQGFVVGGLVALSGGTALAAIAAGSAAILSASLNRPPKPREVGFSTTVRRPTEPRKLIYGEARVGGTILFMESTDNDDLMHIVLELAGHPVDSIREVYLNDDLAVAADGTVQAQFTRTATVQVNCRYENVGGEPETVCDSEEQTTEYVLVEKADGTQTTNPYPTLAAATSKWTADHVMQGRAGLYIRLQWHDDLWKTGIPNISVVVRGKNDIYDPRTSTEGYTANAALCLADYLHDATYGLGAAYGTEIDETELTAAANVCDEAVNLTAGGTEARYTINGRIDTGETHEAIVEQMVAAMAGAAVWSGGKWIIQAGAYTAPTITLDESDVTGPVSINTRLPRGERFNAVKGVFTSPDNDWQPADFPPVTNATYLSQDGGERVWADIELPLTTSTATAQRVAKIQLEQARQEITVTGRFSLGALRLRPGDTVALTLERYGWAAKPFLVVDWTFVWDGVAMGIDLVLRETASTVYDWNSGEETTQDPAPNTNLPNPFVLAAPTGLTLSSGTGQLLVAQDGTIISRIYAFWAIAPGPFVQWYDVRFRKAGRVEWTQFTSQDNFTFIQPVQDGALYDVQVRAANGLGAKSEWAEVTNHLVVGKTAPPSPPDTFNFLRQQDGTREFQWTHAAPPADLAGYKIRFELGTGGTWGTASALHDGLLVASPYETNALAAGTYTFLIKSVDTSGNPSDTALTIIADLGDPRGAQNSIYFEDVITSGWPGTKTSCVVDGQILRAVNQDTWADLTTWAAFTNWVSNPVTSFTYEHGPVDVGIVTTFTPLISVDTPSNATVEISHSDDDGATDPYTAFAVPAGAIEARYVKVRVTVTQAASEVPRLDGLLINMSAEPVDETINDLDTSTLTGANRIGTGDIRLPIHESYGVINQVQIALQNVGAGWSWELIDKDTTTGPRVKIYNAGDTLADATIDAYIKGL